MNHTKRVHKSTIYTCDVCEHISKCKNGLRYHKLSKHEPAICDKKFTLKKHLTSHTRVEHDGVQLQCDQCELKTNYEAQLNKHKRAKHDGVIYQCDQCEYKSKWVDCLNKHKRARHAGIKFVCDICDHKATSQQTMHYASSHVNRHFLSS